MFTLLLHKSVGDEMELKKHEQEFEEGTWTPFEDSNVKGLLEEHALVMEFRSMVLG